MTGENNRIAFSLGRFCIGILVNTFAGVASEVSVNVGVRRFILCVFVIVAAGGFVPVVSLVGNPFRTKRVLTSVSANVAKSVFILVRVRCGV